MVLGPAGSGRLTFRFFCCAVWIDFSVRHLLFHHLKLASMPAKRQFSVLKDNFEKIGARGDTWEIAIVVGL